MMHRFFLKHGGRGLCSLAATHKLSFPRLLWVSAEEVVPINSVSLEQFSYPSIMQAKFLVKPGARPVSALSSSQLKSDIDRVESIYLRNLNLRGQSSIGKSIALNKVALLRLYEMRLEEAEECLQNALIKDDESKPDNLNREKHENQFTQANLAILLQAKENFTEAHNVLSTAVEQSLEYNGYYPKLESIHFQRALSYMVVNQFEEAEEALRDLLKKAWYIFPNSPQRHRWLTSSLATVLRQRDNCDEAKQLYESCLQDFGASELENSVDRINLASLALQENKADKAIALLEVTNTLLSSYFDAEHPLYQVALELQEMSQPISCFETNSTSNFLG